MDLDFDIVVVGAGHAGCEAALAGARTGKRVALITFDIDRIAEMSCNPAIGGLGKSQIVREIDALGGEMGKAADNAAIHFRRLNESRGPAVRARRVQCDMGDYHSYMLSKLKSSEGIHIIEGEVKGLLVENNAVKGVTFSSKDFPEKSLACKTVVLTTGTFLKAIMYTGLVSSKGGRVKDGSADNLSANLEQLGLSLGRLKTGTPPRLDSSSIDFSEMEAQYSDNELLPFSHESQTLDSRRMTAVCYMTRTNEAVHISIRKGLDDSPLYTGVIKGLGPRYCPSIEDKVVRFPQRSSHQVVLEPTDATGKIIYPNGISTSLNLDVQKEMVNSIPGLEKAKIIVPGYAVEYDFVYPTQLLHSLMVKKIKGIFLAGQINGTSGYEEAAGQGLLAGINASFFIDGEKPLVLARHEAYIGVMIDDLVTRGTKEPYRMFSSRAEFRLLLREDNALERLNPYAKAVGLVPREIIEQRSAKLQHVEKINQKLLSIKKVEKGGKSTILEKILRRPGVSVDEILEDICELDAPRDVREMVEVKVKYKGYIERQIREARQLKKRDAKKIPLDFNFEGLSGLSSELLEKLKKNRPATLGEAKGIDGITPAALMLISLEVDRKKRRENKKY